MAETTTQPTRAGQRETFWLRPSTRIGFIVSAMVIYGILMVVSAETSGARASGILPVLLKRIAMVAAGGLAFAIGAIPNYRVWQRHSSGLIALAFILLALVLLPGLGGEVYGAKRWIRVGGFGFQPSEFAKFALLIWLAAYCAPRIRTGAMRHAVTGFLVPGIVIGGICLLTLLGPDFGTSVLIAAIGMCALLLAGTRFLYVILTGMAALPLAYSLVLNVPYRMRRITAFLRPWNTARDAGYQLVQSLIALGSGGTWGEGLGGGALGFLPAAHNDFIFSVVGQQLGFVGCAILILAFLWLMWEGIGVALRCDNSFGSLMAMTISLLICLQAAIHIAVVSGSVPTKGLSLPFVSAGGSSLVATLWASGILVNIALSEERPDEHDHRFDPQQAPLYERIVRSLVGAFWPGFRPSSSPRKG